MNAQTAKTAHAFDTLALADALTGTALGEDGARVVARAIADIAMSDAATKRDLTELGDRLERAMLRQTISLGVIVPAALALVAGLFRFLA